MLAIKLLDGVVLTEPELEDQVAAGSQAAGACCDQPRDDVEAVVAAEQRDARLVVADFRLQRRAIAARRRTAGSRR